MISLEWPKRLTVILFGLLVACDSDDPITEHGPAPAQAQIDESAPEEMGAVMDDELDEQKVDVSLAASNQSDISDLLAQVPADSMFTMVIRDISGLAESQVPGLDWDKAMESFLDDSLPNAVDLDVVAGLNFYDYFPSITRVCKNEATFWVHPGTAEFFEANQQGQALLTRTIGWIFGNVVGVLPVRGSAAFTEMSGLPFEREAAESANRLAESTTDFGVTLSIAKADSISDEELAEQWSSLELTEGAETVSFEAEGVKWEGIRWSYVEPENEVDMSFIFDPMGTKALATAVLKRNPVLVVGVRGDQQIWFYGTEGAIELRQEDEESILDESMKRRIGERAGKIHLFTHTAPELANLDWNNHRALSLIADGYVDRLRAGGLFADFRILDVMVERLAEIDEVVGKRMVTEPVLSFVYENQGIVYEQIGGPELYGIDYETPQIPVDGSKFADSTWLRLQGRRLPRAFEMMKERQMLMGSLVDEGLSRLVGEELHEDVEEEMEPFIKLYDEMLRENVTEATGAIYQFLDDGLSDEWALIVDSEGEYPAFPSLPGDLIEQGRAPRFAFGWPIQDRTDLSQTWTTISEAVNESVTAFAKQYDLDATVPKPLSDEADGGLKHYYYSVPFTNDNCLPCLSLNDEAFSIGSAKRINQALVLSWDRAGTKAKPFTGVRGTVRIGPLADIIEDIEKYDDPSIVIEEDLLEEDLFQEGIEELDKEDEGDLAESSAFEKALKAIRLYDSIEFSHRRRRGVVVTRLHLQLKKP